MYHKKKEWLLEGINGALGVIGKREKRPTPDGADLWSWAAEAGEVLNV
jgi:hypothetical protein